MRKAREGDLVIIEYVGRLEETGEVVENSTDNGPVEFIIGSGVMPPGFEKALIGMGEGEGKSISLSPDEAFGHKDETLLHTVKRSVFGDNIRPEPGMVLGMTLEREGQEHKIPALVTEVQGDDITIDFNHPLAGMTLQYTFTLKCIKD